MNEPRVNEGQPAAPNAAATIVAATAVFAIGYAVVRYHLVGPVPWKDFPFFILITLNFSLGPLNNLTGRVPAGWLAARKVLGMTGFLIVLVHALMSFMLFSPSVYGQFFEADGTLTLFAGLSMLGGTLAFVVLWAYNLSFQTHMREDKAFIGFITSRRFLVWALLLGGAHVFFMGFTGWMNPSGWHGGIPPVSLVAFAFFVGGYGVNLIGRE
jgi:hypothetical protein